MSPPAFKPAGRDVMYVGGQNWDDTLFYGLLRGRDLLIIQARRTWPAAGSADDLDRLKENVLEREYGLEIIQSLLSTAPFGRTNRAFLVKERTGWRLVSRPKPPLALERRAWGFPLVEEDDIEVTRWLDLEVREGMWRGREVDLHVAWEEAGLGLVDKLIGGYRAMYGHGYHFALLGLVARQGRVVGVMTEPQVGRAVQWADRSAVYQAVAELQQHRIVHRGLHKSTILITPAGVRFTSISAVLAFGPDELDAVTAKGAVWHWEVLEEIFAEIKGGTNPCVAPRLAKHLTFVVPQIPAPARPLIYIPAFEIADFPLPFVIEQMGWFFSACGALTPLVRPKAQPKTRRSSSADTSSESGSSSASTSGSTAGSRRRARKGRVAIAQQVDKESGMALQLRPVEYAPRSPDYGAEPSRGFELTPRMTLMAMRLAAEVSMRTGHSSPMFGSSAFPRLQL